MALPVDRVFVHHEGAGKPADGKVLHPYTIIIGVHEWHFDGTPLDDYATRGFNHVSLGICLTGNRMIYPVTDNDLALITDAFADALTAGFVTQSPTILPHKLTPGLTTGTVCPGDKTMERWPEVVGAIWSGLQTPPISPPEEDDVKEAIVYPAAKLTAGPYAGHQPQCLGIVGTHTLQVLSQDQVDRLKPVVGAPVPLPLDFWLDHGVDRHVYVPYNPNG